MAGERQLAVGRKNPHTIVRLRIGRWDDERRLREVCPVRDPLHGVVVETISVQYDGEGVANAKRKVLRRPKPMLLRADSIPGRMTMEDYCSRPHAMVSFAGDLNGYIDEELALHGCQRKVVLAVPQFNGLSNLLAGTDIVATVPDYAAAALVAHGGLRAEPLPFETSQDFELSMAWRGAQDNDPAERWLRSRIQMFVGDPDSL